MKKLFRVPDELIWVAWAIFLAYGVSWIYSDFTSVLILRHIQIGGV